MKLSYDKTSDSFYIHLAEHASVGGDEGTAHLVMHRDADGTLVGMDVQHASTRAEIADDLLTIRLSRKPIARETSPAWNTNVSYAADGSVVEIVLLDVRKDGLLPLGIWK